MFEWDETKRRFNISKHGIDFEAVWDMEWQDAAHTHSGNEEYGEMRSIAIVPLKGRLHICVYTRRGDNMRIISVRKANARERRHYAEIMDN